MTIRGRLVTLGITFALVGSACGGSSLDVPADPSGAVVQAFENMGDWEGAKFTLRLDSDVASLMAMDDGAGEMTPELARGILASYVEMRGTSGDDPQDVADDEFGMLVRIEDLDGFELRTIGKDLYVRAAVRDLVEKYDTSGSGLADLEDGMAQARSFGLGFVDTAVDGGWLHVTGLEELGAMVQGMSGAEQPDPSEAEAIATEGTAILTRFVEGDVAVTYIGADDAGEHVRLTTNGTALLDLAEEMLTLVSPYAGGGFGVADPAVVIDELRSEAGADAARFTLPLEAWIRGDTVTRIGFDVVAMYEANREILEGPGDHMPQGVERFLVTVDIEEFGGGVDAPADATEVDLFSLFGRLMSGFGGGFGEGPPTPG